MWIQGADGPSYDFELVTTPRIGERIAIAHAGQVEEGVVDAVTWQLQAIEASGAEIALEGEPPGSVSLVQVICRPSAEVIRGAFTTAQIDVEATSLGS